MLTIVETNAAAILVVIGLWCSLTWMLTFWVMSQRRAVVEKDYVETIDFLNTYIEEQQSFFSAQVASLLNDIDRLEGHTCIDNVSSVCVPCDDFAEHLYAEQGGE